MKRFFLIIVLAISLFPTIAFADNYQTLDTPIKYVVTNNVVGNITQIVPLLIFICFVILIFISIFLQEVEKSKLYDELREYEEVNKKDLPKNKKGLSEMVMLAKLGEGFDLEGFKKQVFNTYKEIQKAWMDQDLESIRPLVTDTIFNLYRTEILSLKAKKQKNIMEDIEYVSCQLLNVTDNDNKQEITVILNIKCHDYVIDNNESIVYGNKDLISNYKYRLRFIKNKVVSNIKECPNCGAPLENMASDKCEYCNTTTVRKIGNYIMAEKKLLHQFTKRQKSKNQ